MQETYERMRQGYGAWHIFISANVAQKDEILAQLPELTEEQLILEPVKRNTAAAIGYAASVLTKRDPESIFVTINSDQHIKNIPAFLSVLRSAEYAVQQFPQHTILVGVNPTYPETGYGYIELGDEKDARGEHKIFTVRRFVEKPDLATAKEYLASWRYLWNPALFVWRIDTLLALFEKHLPEHAKQLTKLQRATTEEECVTCFEAMDPISIDYGILEKEKDLLVIPADFDWTDVGHWKSVADVLADKNTFHNTKLVEKDSERNFVHSTTGKLVATIGIHDMILVETHDAILLCPKDRAQEVKKVVEELKEKEMEEYV